MKVIRMSRWSSLLVLCMLLTFSCSDDSDDEDTIGNWIRVAPLEGSPRSGAVTFTIGELAYVGLGYGNDSQYFNNFYAYNPTTGIWKRVKDFPGTAREMAVGFSLNGMAYVGLGYNRKITKKELSDFWRYDPITDEWSQLSDFPDSRYSSVSFAIGNTAYVGAGFDGSDVRGDFWEYNAAGDTWNSIATNPGEKKEGAFSFTINGKAYYGGGYNNGTYSDDFWEFNPETNTWTDLSIDSDDDYYDDFSSAVRRNYATAFSLNNLGYVVGGNSGSYSFQAYEFDPTTNRWIEKSDFEGSSRVQAVGFSLLDRAFVGSGYNGSRRTDDFWEFKPFDEYDDKN